MKVTYQRLKDLTKVEQTIADLEHLGGDGFYVLRDAEPYLRNRVGHYAYGAYADGVLIAACFGRLLDEDVIGYYRRLVGDLILDDLLSEFFDKKSSVINVFMVDSELEKSRDLKKVVHELTGRVMEKLEQFSDLTFVDLPQDGTKLYRTRLADLHESGFENLKKIDNFWENYTEQRPEANCWKCGEICHCSALMLLKRTERGGA